MQPLEKNLNLLVKSKYTLLLILINFIVTPKIIGLTVTSNYISACANKHCFTLEHAVTPLQKQTGLMHRKQLDSNKGMLFSWEKPQYITMWMKNTYIPLDIIWINKNKEIVHIEDNCPTLNTKKLTSPKKSLYVIELLAGTAKNISLNIGTQFTFSPLVEKQLRLSQPNIPSAKP